LKIVDAMIGNSSSGLLEMPSFKKGTINLGSRQNGRLKSKSVIDVKVNSKEISNSIHKIYSKDFQRKIKFCKNPYGTGGASTKILKILKKKNLKNILIKKFYDL
jgi:GDP/UDP-N,N'-diacetylbacillosamine 2-epimerase (hydrolysing)